MMNAELTKENPAKATEKVEFIRWYNAPVEKVYRMWTDAELMTRWFIPNERWNSPRIEQDPKPEGAFLIEMHHSDGDLVALKGKYLEVKPNKLLSMTWRGGSNPPMDYDSRLTLRFEPENGGTRLHLLHELLSPTHAEQVAGGWPTFLDQAERFLAEN